MSVDITRLTAHLSPEQQDEVKRAYRRRHENSTAAFLWCFFFGTLGAHRFYLKQWGGGFLRLLVPLIAAAVVIAGIVANIQATVIVAVVIVLLLIALLWEIIDLFRIDHEVYTRNLKLAEDLIAGALLKDKSIERRADAKMEGLMLQAQSEARTGADAERREVATEAAAAVPAVAATVAERETTPASGDEDETVGAAEARSSEAAGAASDTYVERDVTEISDDPNATQHAARYPAGPQNDWSTTETVHTEDAQVRTAEDEGSETIAEPGALGTAGAALGAAAVAGYALDEAITRSHSETDHSTADSLETHTTLSAADAEQEDEAVAAETEDEPAPAPVPAFSDGEAPTWPDHPVVMFEEPVLVEPESVEPDAGVEQAAAATTFDVTDTTGVMGAVKPIADIEPEAAPLIIALPTLAAAGAFEAATQPGAGEDEALVEPAGPDATDLVVAPAAPASESADEVPLLLVPVEELDEPSFGRMPMADEPARDAEAGAVPEEAYIPPTVPVVSAEPEVAAPVAFAEEPATAEAEHPTGETLAELAAFAGAAGVGIVGAEALAHRYDEPTQQPEPAPVVEESMPVAEGPTPPAVELPVTVPEPTADLAPPPASEAAPVVAAAAAPIAAEAVAAEAMEPPAPPRKQFRRIREYLQVKREGQVVEELVAEEIAEVDMDPEPIRQRLRDQLHQQALERGLE